jgi:23S rRNA (cytidine1920-2'-O)/16S rRNA (cytidine1409-2'-O)-methyltransferase
MRTMPLLDLASARFPDRKREELLAFILAGNLKVNGERIRDPRHPTREDAELEQVQRRYVSRGGFKLAGALSAFAYDPAGKVFLDAGSSTGGFTDCLLQSGAFLVHAVDTGTNQLDWRLRRDDRIRVYEKTRIQNVSSLEPAPDAAVADLSFRSLSGVARHILDLTIEGILIALVKPQFEIGADTLEFDGVVRDTRQIVRIVTETARVLYREGAYLMDAALSPITGAKGNTEVFFLLRSRQIQRSMDTEEECVRTGLASVLRALTEGAS